MPLLVDGIPYNVKFTSVLSLLDAHPSLKRSSEAIIQDKTRCFESLPKTVYVYQREIAVSNQQDDTIDILGSDDATTCHIVILRNSASGVTALGHFDGEGISQGLHCMVQQVQEEAASDGRIDAFMFGGFCDDRNSSAELTSQIVGALQEQGTADIHLQCLCCTEFNNIVKGGINWPIVYGVGVNVKTGEIFPAEFEDKGPVPALRSARIFGGVHPMTLVYEPVAKVFTVRPFSYSVRSQFRLLLTLPDEVFLKYTSTSPKVEKPGYVSSVRATFQFMISNPHPGETLFRDGRPLVYCLNERGWETKDEKL